MNLLCPPRRGRSFPSFRLAYGNSKVEEPRPAEPGQTRGPATPSSHELAEPRSSTGWRQAGRREDWRRPGPRHRSWPRRNAKPDPDEDATSATCLPRRTFRTPRSSNQGRPRRARPLQAGPVRVWAADASPSWPSEHWHHFRVCRSAKGKICGAKSWPALSNLGLGPAA